MTGTTITPQAARRLVTAIGWGKIHTGHEWPSTNGQWIVYKAGHGIYKKRPAN